MYHFITKLDKITFDLNKLTIEQSQIESKKQASLAFETACFMFLRFDYEISVKIALETPH